MVWRSWLREVILATTPNSNLVCAITVEWRILPGHESLELSQQSGALKLKRCFHFRIGQQKITASDVDQQQILNMF